MIYHALNYKEIDGEPLYDSNRHIFARVLGWTKDGIPFFGQDLSVAEIAEKFGKNQMQ